MSAMSGGAIPRTIPAPSDARVAILLCTFQGQHFLAEQLESVQAQTHSNWAIWASDDRSSDATVSILESYRAKWGEDRFSMKFGPAKGFRANFLALACNTAIQADYFALCDQDDFWDPDKLATAIAWLDTIPQQIPALYCARTRLIDEENKEVGFSPLFAKPLSFRNALVQSVAGGNTMVFNAAARALLIEAGDDVDVQAHDWWAYLVVTGCGGRVHYDAVPTVSYRQHGRNQVGSNISWWARWLRIRKLLAGRFKAMNDRNCAALQRLRHRLTPENQRIFDEFERARKQWLIPRAIGIRRSGVYHHTFLGTLGLIAATMLKKL